ncbi:MAG: cbb3-type cytochrome c oxidase N-terminal domain-containing protein [Verrucomicrobiota bacterium]
MSSDPEIKVASYASKKGEVVIRPHEYDGIQEYDQTLPNWWLFIFYGTLILFPVCWLLYYQFGFMRPDGEAVAAEMAQIEKVKAKALDEMLAHLDDSVLNDKWAKDPQTVANGRETFMANCTACHGQDLSAKMMVGNQSIPLPGLSLIDGQWKYGSRPMDIFKLINGGTPPESAGNNGARMEAWGQKMPPIKIVELVSFLMSQNPKDFPDAHN